MTTLEIYDQLINATNFCDTLNITKEALRQQLTPAIPSFDLYDVNPNGFTIITNCPEDAEYEVEVRHNQMSSYSLTGRFIRPPEQVSPAMLGGGWGTAYVRIRVRYPDRDDLVSEWSEERSVGEPSSMGGY